MRLGHVLFIVLLQYALSAQAPTQEPRMKLAPESAVLMAEINEVLKDQREITLYSIDPGKELKRGPDRIGFHGYQILGEKKIDHPSNQQEFLRALKGEFAPSNLKTFCVFAPHHAIRLKSSSTTVDLVICYTCSEVEGHIKDARLGPYSFSGGSGAQIMQFFVSNGLSAPRL